MTRRAGRALALAGMLCSSVVHGQSTSPPTVEETLTDDALLHRWLARSPEVASWRTRVSAARFDQVTARLWPNPQLQLNTLVSPWGAPPDGVVNYGAQVSFSLPVFGQIAAREAAANAALEVVEVDVLQALWDRASEIERAAVDRAFADARIALAERNLAELARVEEIVGRRVSQGLNSTYDALRVAASTSTLRAARAEAIAQRDRAEASLLALVADPTLASAPITRAGIAGFHGPEDVDSLVRIALLRRPDRMLAQRGVLAAEAQARRGRAEVAPTPSVWLGGYVTHAQLSGSITGGVSVSLPAFDRNQGVIGRATREAEGQRALVDALDARIRFEVHGAFRARALARAALDEFRRTGLAPAGDLLRRAELTYTSGTTGATSFTIMDLLDAYRAVWDARAQELALERTFADAEAELERATALLAPMGSTTR